jgi:hypothetical protein
MLRGLKIPRILLALIISLSFPVLSGYLLYCNLADDDLLHDLQFENPDVDNPLPNCHNNLKLFGSIGSNVLFHVVFLETCLSERLHVNSFQIFPRDLRTFILRC